MSKIKCILKINGVSKELKIHEDKQLIFVIRDEFGLTGTKLGCGLEQCGSCAILIDGKKKLSCNIFASDYQNNEITTIEGISNDRVLNVVQKAFKKFNAAQCGYCTSGIIISLTELFNKFKNPKKEQIIKALEGHLCRCGSHSSVFKAIESIMTS
tara:strand:- start:946 stop:1410 length:465 start_codon:yes stop_codon:yes gene_type:complete